MSSAGFMVRHMALLHRDRFKLKSRLLDTLSTQAWTYEKLNLLFGELGLGRPDDSGFGPSLSDIVSNADDDVLVDLYALATGIDTDEVIDAVDSTTTDTNWRAGYARVFLSHSAKHKAFVGDVANELAVVGIHSFVAHDTIAYSKPWQTQIEQALRSMQALVAIIHPEFNDSPWCHQEVGWALGRRVPRYAIRVGPAPEGFIGREQWPSADGRTAKPVADIIYGWVASVPGLGPSIIEAPISLEAISA